MKTTKTAIANFLLSKKGMIIAWVMGLLGAWLPSQTWLVDNPLTVEVEGFTSVASVSLVALSVLGFLWGIFSDQVMRNFVGDQQQTAGLLDDGIVGAKTALHFKKKGSFWLRTFGVRPMSKMRGPITSLFILLICLAQIGCSTPLGREAQRFAEEARDAYDIQIGVKPVILDDGRIGLAGPLIAVPKKPESIMGGKAPVSGSK